MPDRFSNHAGGLESPASSGFPVTPADGTDLLEVTRAIYIGGSGNLAAVMMSGEDVTFNGIPGGTVLPVRVRRIKATGTTATAIVGLL